MSSIVNKNFEITVVQDNLMVPGGIIGMPPTVTKDNLITTLAPSADAPDGADIMTKEMTEKLGGMIAELGCKSPGAATLPTPLGTDGPGVPPSPGAVIISAGSTKVKCSGEACHIEGDIGTCACQITFTPTAPPSTPVQIPGSCTFQITNAGQDKAAAI